MGQIDCPEKPRKRRGDSTKSIGVLQDSSIFGNRIDHLNCEEFVKVTQHGRLELELGNSMGKFRDFRICTDGFAGVSEGRHSSPHQENWDRIISDQTNTGVIAALLLSMIGPFAVEFPDIMTQQAPVKDELKRAYSQVKEYQTCAESIFCVLWQRLTKFGSSLDMYGLSMV